MFNVQVKIYGANNEVVWEVMGFDFPNMGMALRYVAGLNISIGNAYKMYDGRFIDQHIWGPALTKAREQNHGVPTE